MFLDKLIQIFGILAGNGRAWMLRVEPMRSIVKALLTISDDYKKIINKVPEQQFPWLCDDEVIPYWERHFGLNVNFNDSLSVRRQRVIAEYLSSGGQSAQYLEYVFQTAGYSVDITENLDGLDLGTEWDESSLKLANGSLYWYETGGSITLRDPIDKPTSTIEWKKVFIASVALEPEEFETFKKLMLKYKPNHTVVIVVDTSVNKVYLDADLVTPANEATSTALDADLVTIGNQDTALSLDANLIFL